MSSSASATLPPADVMATNKAPASNRKKRRPTFRPASQRKANKATAASVTNNIATSADSNDEKETASSAGDQITAPSTVSGSVDVNGTPDSGKTSALSKTRRAGKKRKASTGVAIGSSRPIREEEGAAPEEGLQVAHPSVVSEPSVPSALPGQVTLQAYCSKYRTKEKRKPKAKATPEPQPDASHGETATTSGPVVQVVNGEIVLQESSMVVPGARRSVQEVEEEFQHVVEEESHSAVVGATYHSFVSRRAPQHWTVEETKLFYHALRQVGTDFGTMVAYFDNRSRKQLKRKYQMENSKHPDLIALALNPKSKVPLDLTVFNVQVEPASAQTQSANSEAVATPPEPPSTSVPSTLPQESPAEAAVTQQTEEEITEPFDDEQLVHDSLFEEEQDHDTLESRQAEAGSIPPLDPSRAPQARKSKRPKFKAVKAKARTK